MFGASTVSPSTNSECLNSLRLWYLCLWYLFMYTYMYMVKPYYVLLTTAFTWTQWNCQAKGSDGHPIRVQICEMLKTNSPTTCLGEHHLTQHATLSTKELVRQCVTVADLEFRKGGSATGTRSTPKNFRVAMPTSSHVNASRPNWISRSNSRPSQTSRDQ